MSVQSGVCRILFKINTGGKWGSLSIEEAIHNLSTAFNTVQVIGIPSNVYRSIVNSCCGWGRGESGSLYIKEAIH